MRTKNNLWDQPLSQLRDPATTRLARDQSIAFITDPALGWAIALAVDGRKNIEENIELLSQKHIFHFGIHQSNPNL